jgi:hypothetical protein
VAIKARVNGEVRHLSIGFMRAGAYVAACDFKQAVSGDKGQTGAAQKKRSITRITPPGVVMTLSCDENIEIDVWLLMSCLAYPRIGRCAKPLLLSSLFKQPRLAAGRVGGAHAPSLPDAKFTP